jgi:hypothetical protein
MPPPTQEAFMYDDEISTFPTPVHDFFPAPDPAPAAPPEPVLSDAERKRRDRAARREAGMPDPRVVDTILLNALVESLVKGGAAEIIVRRRSTDPVRIHLTPILRDALNALVHEKGVSKAMATQLVMRRLKLG